MIYTNGYGFKFFGYLTDVMYLHTFHWINVEQPGTNGDVEWEWVKHHTGPQQSPTASVCT